MDIMYILSLSELITYMFYFNIVNLCFSFRPVLVRNR